MANNDFFSLQHSFSVMISQLHTITTVILHKLPKNSKLGNLSYCLEKLYTVQSLVYSGLSVGFFIYIQYINTH